MSSTDIKIVYQDGVFDTILSATDKLAKLVKPTFGPSSNKVLIGKLTHKMTLDDGVQIARDLELEDSAENEVLRAVREVATKTSARAGDGTTCALIMNQAILHEVARMGVFNSRKIELELRQGAKEFVEQLKAKAKIINKKEDLIKVARTAFDNEEIAELVADVYIKLGKDSLIAVENSQTLDTYADISEGTILDRGYISPYMVNQADRMECILKNPYFLITDYRLTQASDLQPIMNTMAAQQKANLVVIAENVEEQALATLVVNLPRVVRQTKDGMIRGQFPNCAINAPSGENRTNTLEDIALLTGAKVFSKLKGDRLEEATINDLGQAEKFVCSREKSIIFAPKGNKLNIKKAIADLTRNIENEPAKTKKEQLQKRLSLFTNAVATVYVGAPTEIEQKAVKRKVENVVNSVGSAYKHGVVCGGGFELARIKTSSPILNSALQQPSKQMLLNMGIEDPVPLKKNEAYNAVTKKIGDFLNVGVADPIETIIAAVESAVSIACTLISVKGIVAEQPEKIKIE